MTKLKYLLVITFLVLVSCTKDDDILISVIDEESLTLRLNQILEESNFPGFTIGIVKNGNGVYQHSFGFQNIENNISYTNQTTQPIASISKTFIGVAVVKAIELGYFTLETPINNILEELLINPKNQSAEIRIKHLVNHTSGLVDDDDTYLASYYILNGQNTSSTGSQILQSYGITEHNPKTLKELIESYYYLGGDYYSVDNFTNSEPGEEENYTNIGASLMAYLIEKSSGMSYQNFLQTYIFDILDMNNTSFEYEFPNNQLATLYFDKETPLPYYGLESFPDGALKTSNEDLMKFMLNMIKGQRGESNTLFSESYYDLLFTETSETYTIFWDIDPGTNAFGHNGGDPGVGTELHFSGPINAGFFLISNYDTSTDEHETHYNEIVTEINESINMFLSN